MINTQNQPAFPQDCRHKDGSGYQFFGMTLRDYFAAKAMQGELSAMVTDSDGASGLDVDVPNFTLDILSKHWYRIADAMLKARDQ